MKAQKYLSLHSTVDGIHASGPSRPSGSIRGFSKNVSVELFKLLRLINSTAAKKVDCRGLKKMIESAGKWLDTTTKYLIDNSMFCFDLIIGQFEK